MKSSVRPSIVAALALGLGCVTYTEVPAPEQDTQTSTASTAGSTSVAVETSADTTSGESPDSTGSPDSTAGTSTSDATSTGALDSATGTSTGQAQDPDLEILTEGPGLNLEIDDGAYDGTLGSMLCIPFSVRSDGVDLVDRVTVQVGLDHDYIGDLVIKLVSAEGTIITLLSRPGDAEPADDGEGVYGDSSNLSSFGRISFFDGAKTDAEDMGSGINTHLEVCLSDGLCDYQPNPGSAVPGDLLSLEGEDAVGSWRLCVGDAALLNLGILDFVELTIEQTP